MAPTPPMAANGRLWGECRRLQKAVSIFRGLGRDSPLSVAVMEMLAAVVLTEPQTFGGALVDVGIRRIRIMSHFNLSIL